MNSIICIPIISVILDLSFVNMFSFTSYNASYTHPNERNCVAVIEQGILWLRKRGSGTQSKEKRSGQRSCGSD